MSRFQCFSSKLKIYCSALELPNLIVCYDQFHQTPAAFATVGENLKYIHIKREMALPIACQQDGGIINLLVLFQLTFGRCVDQLFFSSRVSVFNCIVDGLEQALLRGLTK